MPCLLPHLVSALLATTSLVGQISIFQAFQVVPKHLLAQDLLYLPFLLSVLQDQLFLFFRISRRSHGTLRTFVSLWSPPATWSPRSNGTRISGGTCRTDLLTWLTVLGGHKLFKLFADFFSYFVYGDASWSVVHNVSLSYPDCCWYLYWQRADCSQVKLDNTC